MNQRTRMDLHAVGRVALGAALLLALAAVGAGCLHGGAAAANNSNPAAAPGGPVKNSDRYKVTADTAPFFHYGPQQLNGSDLDLKKETRITMVSHGRGYSQIRLADGQTGYVGTEDIAPLDANEIAAEDAQLAAAAAAAAAPPGAMSGPASGGTYNSGPRVEIPPEAGRSESLPTHDPSATPTPPPATIFRY